MASIQKQLIEFHDKIKLKRYSENQILRDRRDTITNKIENGINKLYEEKEEKAPKIEFFDQGSYSIDTGIIPKEGNYDIDEGIILDLYKEDYEPLYFKTMIRDIMKNHTKKKPDIKKPCVTITYSINDEPQYHVDLPVYLKSNADDNLYLAWGKEFAIDDNIEWQVSDPKGLSNHIKEAFSGDDKKQFKRVVRYLKKWKDIKFASETSEGTPPSIALTLIAADSFIPKKCCNEITGKEEYDDLTALKELIDSIIELFKYEYDSDRKESLYTIKYYLPVEPKEISVFSKMTNLKMNKFYEKINELKDAVEYAIGTSDPHDACKELSKFFGDKLSIPESIENRYKTVGASSAPASNSANEVEEVDTRRIIK